MLSDGHIRRGGDPNIEAIGANCLNRDERHTHLQLEIVSHPSCDRRERSPGQFGVLGREREACSVAPEDEWKVMPAEGIGDSRNDGSSGGVHDLVAPGRNGSC